MTVTCVHIHVKPEDVDSFIEATIANHLEAVKEPGNLRFDFVQNSEDKTRFMLYEAYDTEGSATAHKNTPHYLAWRDAVMDMMAELRYGIKYDSVFPLKQ